MAFWEGEYHVQRQDIHDQLYFAETKETASYFHRKKKKGLFDISKEFHSGVCNHNKSGASPRRQGKSLIEGKRKLRVADILNRVLAVHWSSCSQKSSLSSSCWTLVSSQGMRAPSSGFPILFN